jgi:hypothetical protein
VPRITDFCICIYVFGCKLSPFRLSDCDFGITPVDDITIRITCTVFCFHIAHISLGSSWYLLCFSVIVLARLCVLLLLLLLLLTAIELSLSGSSPYTSTDRTNKNIHKRNNTKNTVQKIQNTINTSTHIAKTQ